MPYVEPAQRPYLDEVVESMFQHSISATGDLNYVLYAFCKRYCKGYQATKNFMAELRECEKEIRRTILTPYEDGKREENGDVY
jgi:hypothetical protein